MSAPISPLNLNHDQHKQVRGHFNAIKEYILIVLLKYLLQLRFPKYHSVYPGKGGIEFAKTVTSPINIAPMIKA